AEFKGVVIANGTLAEPNMPAFEGQFAGELLHTAAYKSAEQFRGKRVLVIGAGNSGCDIAVDAVHHAKSVDLSVRRGYYFVPKYVFGKPADTVGGGKIKMPPWLKQKIDSTVLKWFTGDPVRFGLPKPDYKMYESHPVVNSLVLHHMGHGDIGVKADIARFDGPTVHFKDGRAQDYDLVLCATGYRLHYPFIDPALLGWQGMAPQLYLNILSPRFDNLAVLGMIEASGIGWQGRHEQAELVARFFKAQADGSPRADALRTAKAGPPPDLSGGFKYLKLERMAYYVHKDTYRAAVRAASASLST
ncbi:MAG: NAD(P)-binding domain-containing protein, partial [Rhizobacter sp.]